MWDVTFNPVVTASYCIFLLTHPVWDVTDAPTTYDVEDRISTHTSRVGCDGTPSPDAPVPIVFLLTHPVWDVTLNDCIPAPVYVISTHTSRVGCDGRALAELDR